MLMQILFVFLLAPPTVTNNESDTEDSMINAGSAVCVVKPAASLKSADASYFMVSSAYLLSGTVKPSNLNSNPPSGKSYLPPTVIGPSESSLMTKSFIVPSVGPVPAAPLLSISSPAAFKLKPSTSHTQSGSSFLQFAVFQAVAQGSINLSPSLYVSSASEPTTKVAALSAKFSA